MELITSRKILHIPNSPSVVAGGQPSIGRARKSLEGSHKAERNNKTSSGIVWVFLSISTYHINHYDSEFDDMFFNFSYQSPYEILQSFGFRTKNVHIVQKYHNLVLSEPVRPYPGFSDWRTFQEEQPFLNGYFFVCFYQKLCLSFFTKLIPCLTQNNAYFNIICALHCG